MNKLIRAGMIMGYRFQYQYQYQVPGTRMHKWRIGDWYRYHLSKNRSGGKRKSETEAKRKITCRMYIYICILHGSMYIKGYVVDSLPIGLLVPGTRYQVIRPVSRYRWYLVQEDTGIPVVVYSLLFINQREEFEDWFSRHINDGITKYLLLCTNQGTWYSCYWYQYRYIGAPGKLR